MRTKKQKVFISLVLISLIMSIPLIGMNLSPGVALTPEMYFKADFIDYAPSGMPDFDQRQLGWDNPIGSQVWTWCAPVALADSLWWIDSAYEAGATPPPQVSDAFRLVSNFTASIDDHDPANVVWFVKYLAYLMDTDSVRTLTLHKGTSVFDMQAGIAQYLSWTGLNSLGDVDGDGKVDQTDYNIVYASNGTSPGQAAWMLAADIWPETVTGPYTADNKIDNNDLNLVTANMDKTGMFYERTVQAPEFYFIEEGVLECENVLLVLGFYRDEFRDEDLYPYGSGHVVAVAGVNSTTMKIAISDPIQDNAEPLPHGNNGPGRVLPPPPQHMHGPGPTYPLHDNASYVSQDIYNVTWAPPSVPAANFTLANYTSSQYPGFPPPTAAVEWAAIISPLETAHDVYTVYKNFLVKTISNSRVSNIDLNVTTKTMSFNVTGPSGTTGFCNITFPKEMLDATLKAWIVLVDNIQVVPLVSWNSTHNFIHFNYTHSTKRVDIIGTIVVPEFSSFLVLPFFMMATLVILIAYRRRHLKKRVPHLS